ncbi:MAG: hypothetical protein IH965_14115 [Gemmatimonadetes bacterium]|nr:hypothetical protein [Gemmatimonadota bacterium]
MKAVSRSLFAALTLGMFAAPASAQVFGMPVDFRPVGTGVTIHGGIGRGVNDSSGKITSAGGGVTIGLPSFQIGAAVSRWGLKTGEPKEISFGGHAAFKLPLPPATPVSLSIGAGVGVVSTDITTTESVTSIFVPVGLTLAINVPSPTLDVTPWISPQFRYSRTGAIGTDPSESNSDFGVSGGLSITLPMGFGFQGLFDYDNGSEAFTVGGGVHFTIAVPSLAPGM